MEKSLHTHPYHDIKIEYHHIDTMPSVEINWMCNIVEENMKDIYKKADWTWNRDEKILELSETENYLVIEGAGFLGFRDELDDSETRDTTYIYEIQISHLCVGRGLGSKLIDELLKTIHNDENLPKLVIVFYENSSETAKMRKITIQSILYSRSLCQFNNFFFQKWTT